MTHEDKIYKMKLKKTPNFDSYADGTPVAVVHSYVVGDTFSCLGVKMCGKKSSFCPNVSVNLPPSHQKYLFSGTTNMAGNNPEVSLKYKVVSSL